MKFNLKYLTILLAGFVALYSCDDDTVTYDEIALEVVDGFYRALTPTVPFVAGTDAYEIKFIVVPGVADVARVDVYKQFTDSKTGETSNEVLLGSYDVDAAEAATNISDEITYDDLKEGLTLNGSPLPADDIEIGIGSSWKLTLVPIASDGSEASLSDAGSTINVAVLSPFAGDYLVTESEYYRINILNGAGWNGQTRFIGSINDTTFSHPDWFGPFNVAATLKFIVRSADNTVWVPKVGQVPGLNQENGVTGDPILNCEEDAAQFVDVPCAGSNVLIPDGGGEHTFKLTYGYYTASGDENEGSRQVYEVLVKIVE